MRFRRATTIDGEISGLRFEDCRRKLPTFMQSNDSTASDSFYKLWAWFEDNLKTIVIATGIFAVVLFVFSYYSYSQKQKEITAGQALSKVIVSSGAGQQADAYLKIAGEYPATLAGQRALLEAGA